MNTIRIQKYALIKDKIKIARDSKVNVKSLNMYIENVI